MFAICGMILGHNCGRLPTRTNGMGILRMRNPTEPPHQTTAPAWWYSASFGRVGATSFCCDVPQPGESGHGARVGARVGARTHPTLLKIDHVGKPYIAAIPGLCEEFLNMYAASWPTSTTQPFSLSSLRSIRCSCGDIFSLSDEQQEHPSDLLALLATHCSAIERVDLEACRIGQYRWQCPIHTPTDAITGLDRQ
ncbi:hypothetical protein M427DRAFT_255448 [Gonapodya prolifera JEL478]|uniref:Uncharacterized protein n=1 Tax=Gonapodya prolifera (strain JEL478) TaxID=1344416 RepID=A0A139ALG2_GONPJ|nr:hypothetical protein M427DRAFT_255448 [Gonapodya prolifera JEL478]|eukprot:KXS17627.1 hypothetical protein M427DRAFT_255448 [Gonapodya prolifera JEL478]